MISKGRLVSGIVRGGGQEQFAAGVNPAYNRERFQEAHDLIVDAWTAARAVPLGGHALPAPRRQPVGGAAAEAPSAHLGPRRPQPGDDHLGGAAAAIPTSRSNDRDRGDQEDLGAVRQGRRRGRLRRRARVSRLPEQCHVAETEEKALRTRGSFMWLQGEFTGLAHPVWDHLPGYDPANTRRQRLQSPPYPPPRFEDELAKGRLIAGTGRCASSFCWLMERLRPGIFGFWSARWVRDTTRTRAAASGSWARKCCRPFARSGRALELWILSRPTPRQVASSPSQPSRLFDF